MGIGWYTDNQCLTWDAGKPGQLGGLSWQHGLCTCNVGAMEGFGVCCVVISMPLAGLPWSAGLHSVPIPGTCECVTLHGKRNFEVVIKLRLWDGEIIQDYPDGPKVITRVLIKGREEIREKDASMKARGWKTERNGATSRNWKKARKQIFPWSCQKALILILHF